MAGNVNAIFVKNVIRGSHRFSPTAYTISTVLTGGAEGTRIDGIVVTSSDTSAKTLVLYLNDGANDIALCTVTIPALAGYSAAVAAVNVQDPALLPFLDAEGRWKLKYNDVLKAAIATDVTADKVIDIVAFGGEY